MTKKVFGSDKPVFRICEDDIVLIAEQEGLSKLGEGIEEEKLYEIAKLVEWGLGEYWYEVVKAACHLVLGKNPKADQ